MTIEVDRTTQASHAAAQQREDMGHGMGEPVDATEALTNERKKTHGDWAAQAMLANNIKFDMHQSANWETLEAGQREALDMIAVKISRILTGNPDEPDHWDDIKGYAHLGKGGHT